MKGRIEDLNLDKKRKYKARAYSHKGFNDYVMTEGILVYSNDSTFLEYGEEGISSWYFLSNDSNFMGDRCEHWKNQSEFKFSWLMIDDEYDVVEILGTYKPNPWQGSKLLFTMP